MFSSFPSETTFSLNASRFFASIFFIILLISCSFSSILKQSTQLHEGEQKLLVINHSQYSFMHCDLLHVHPLHSSNLFSAFLRRLLLAYREILLSTVVTLASPISILMRLWEFIHYPYLIVTILQIFGRYDDTFLIRHFLILFKAFLQAWRLPNFRFIYRNILVWCPVYRDLTIPYEFSGVLIYLFYLAEMILRLQKFW